MKKLLTLTAVIGLAVTSACTMTSNTNTNKTSFVGSYADQCAAPASSFTFNQGGTGNIHARGQSRNFTWYQKGNIAYVSVPSSGGTPAQTYGLSRTQSGIYLTSLAVNGQNQDLTKASASERTKVKCG